MFGFIFDQQVLELNDQIRPSIPRLRLHVEAAYVQVSQSTKDAEHSKLWFRSIHRRHTLNETFP